MSSIETLVKELRDILKDWYRRVDEFERFTNRENAIENSAYIAIYKRCILDMETALRNAARPTADVANPAVDDVAKPIDMILHCPKCHFQHVDGIEPELAWNNPPHRSHRCRQCGTVWRPADVPTNGVATIKTHGKADSWPDNGR